MRTPFFPALIGMLLVVPSLAAQQPNKPPEKPKVEKPKEPPKPGVDFSKFKFMEGCWRGEADKDQEVEENWTSPGENVLLSTTRYYAKRHVNTFDFNRIEWVDSVVVFGILSKGKPEDVYTLKTLADGYAVFENPTKKAFPQRISYRATADGSLIPRLEGDGPSFELRFHRVKCPGSEIKIKD